MERLEINEQGEIVEAREKYFVAPRSEDLRRRPRGQRRTFEVNKMWELHHEITRRLLLGQKNVDIARALHITEATVSYTRNSKIVQGQLSMMKAARDADSIDLARDIREKAPKALRVLEGILDDNGETIAMGLVARTAESWMDRAGYAAPKRVEALVAHLTADEIERIKKEAVADAEASAIVVEGRESDVEAD